MTELLPTLPGYTCSEKIYDGAKSVIYRGQQTDNNTPVILKFLKTTYPSFRELTQFRNQYSLAKNLSVKGILRPLALTPYHNRFVLVMEDTNSIDLQAYLRTHTFDLDAFFDFSIAMADILQGLYQHHVLHKDIKPANILIQPDTQDIHLIDFSCSSLLPREIQTLQTVNELQGTLAYISPEQTGRMNRGIDYRTDFYAFGVSCYEILTGQRPFYSADPIALVHSHLAKLPTPLTELDPKIPQALNDVVLKLMAKTIEQRYQSATGLKHDLQRCQREWTDTQHITPFALGQQDIAERFQVSDKLYGRHDDVLTLLQAFDRVSQGEAEMMLVSGVSGIGKTALINEAHKPITRQRGYFIKGKFDQFKRDIPFSALMQALRLLIQQLLTEEEEQRQLWKAAFSAALGQHADVIIEVIPELSQLMGHQPQATALEGQAAQNRFHLFFQRFIGVLTSEAHPLVLFLDDLQWVDSGTLQLLPLLMDPEKSHHLLLIMAYRDNEISQAHPFRLTVDSIQTQHTTTHHICLNPLNIDELNHLVSDSLCCAPEQTHQLTEIILQKTQGNPFYASQFLKFLYEDGLLTFDQTQGFWQCPLEEVTQLAASDNIIDLMDRQLQTLPDSTQEALKLAACIGNQFSLHMLAAIYQHTLSETAAAVWPALQKGFVLPMDDGYKYFQIDAGNQAPIGSVVYRFLHDRIQQAAYKLIHSDEKAILHLRIGRLLMHYQQTHAELDLQFDLVNQLNQGADLITDPSERTQLAELNLHAGQKASLATAYKAACGYFEHGIACLSTTCWETQYALTLALYQAATEAHFLHGDYRAQQHATDAVLTQAQHVLDTIKVRQLQSLCMIAQGMTLEAIELALPILAQLGVDLPRHPEAADFQTELKKTQNMLAAHTIESLTHLPELDHPEVLAAIQLMSKLTVAFYIAMPALFPLAIFKKIQLSLVHGNCPDMIPFYAAYGLILSGQGDINQGYAYGQLSLALLEKTPAAEAHKALTYVNVTASMMWKVHITKTLPFFEEAYRGGLETGDLHFSSSGALWLGVFGYFSGQLLVPLEKSIANYSQAIRQMHQKNCLTWNHQIHQVVLNLLGDAEHANVLQGPVYTASKHVSEHQTTNDYFALFNVDLYEAILSYIFNHYAQAQASSDRARQHLSAVMGVFNSALFYFYDGLIQLAIYPTLNPTEQTAIWQKVTDNQKKMAHWAAHAPMNFQHKWDLVEAEKARVEGDILAAEDYYDRAIEGAKTYGYVQEEALANEAAGRFYLGRQKARITQIYLIDAYYAYARWGAKAKVLDLEQRYPEPLAPIFRDNLALPQKPTTSLTDSSTGANTSKLLDINTAMKASRILSGELTLNALLRKMLDIVMENAGAGRCLLILHDAGQWIIKGESVLLPHRKQMFDSIPLCDYTNLPASLIQHVIDTQQALVLDDASDFHQRFHADAYFIAKPDMKSVLCQPILSQTRLMGLLYLENALIAEVFHSGRQDMTHMLASQAAIAIENALLYENLEEKVKARTQELKKTQAELIKRAREAGMAEIAQGVMHNLGNALTPLKTAANLAYTLVRESKLRQLDNALEPISQIIEHSDHAGKTRLNEIIKLLPAAIEQEYQTTEAQLYRVNDRIHYIEGIIHLQSKYAHTHEWKEDLDFNQLVKDALDMMEESLRQYAVVVEFNEGALPIIQGETHQLLQVFINLIKNAIEAMQTAKIGQRQLHIHSELKKTAQGPQFIAHFEDTGCGFTPEMAAQLFNFSYTTKTHGRGIGLHASANYLNSQEGSLTASSQGVGQGAVFVVALPIPPSYSAPRL